MMETRTRWLCPRYHVFESKEMTTYQTVQMKDNEVSSDDGDDDDAMIIEILDNCGANGSDHATEKLREKEEEADNTRMDSGFMNESKKNDHHSLDMDERSTDCESMDKEEGDVLYEHEYQKNKAVEQLSAVFELLKIESIHDKYARDGTSLIFSIPVTVPVESVRPDRTDR